MVVRSMTLEINCKIKADDMAVKSQGKMHLSHSADRSIRRKFHLLDVGGQEMGQS